MMLRLVIRFSAYFIVIGRQYQARFKDFISTPKINNYKSIHTAIIGPNKERVEIQIQNTTNA